MNTTRPFSADSNKYAYAQAFSRTSTRHADRGVRIERRRSFAQLFSRRHAA
ncbi:hypothetical protein [Jatrophihabitans endophyticus]|uniref:hypothetical protein n=1 Tax=Jatrophihabitans endophyticus TaxID=1206085 RepID=UPI0019EC7E24|nr:hypothetical protein [Jatrophihabitans endophyticus]MBE7187588.1 hypothetical protein [Jatrophihabitans endophyticus]